MFSTANSGWLVTICIAVLIYAFGVKAQSNITAPEEEEIAKARNGITLPPEVANILSPGNQECKTSSGKTGTCDWPSSCTSKGGVASGNCLGGLQICCQINKACDGTSSYNNTYFEPDNTKQLTKCSIQISKASPDVCQIRLEFDKFAFAAAEGGVCKMNKFSVFGVPKVPDICGNNAGQHMILDVKSVDAPIVLMVSTSDTNVKPDYSIKVVHIPCSDTFNLAPKNCLQYLKTAEGTIKPFNVVGTGSTLDYNVCVKVPEGKRVCIDNCTPPTVPPAKVLFDDSCLKKFWLFPCLSKKTSSRDSCEHNKLCSPLLADSYCSNESINRFRISAQSEKIDEDCYKYTLD